MEPLPILQRLYLWACERLYAELAWSYDSVSWLVSFGAWSCWQATALRYLRGASILEIGFGTGTLLATMAQQRVAVTGLELSSAMHEQTARKLDRLDLTVPRVQAPTQQMPFAGDTFDTIVSTFPSGYIIDPATLCECTRILRQPTAEQPGGRLVIVMSVSAPQSLWSLILRLIAPKQRPSATGSDPLLTHFAAAGLTATHVHDQQGGTVVHLILAEPTHSATPSQPPPLARAEQST